MPHQLDRWMYRSGHPNGVAAFLNGIWRLVGLAGLPPHRLNTLEVRGRRSGRPTSFPLVVADYQGERYLVAMLGEGVNWVANVRAADGRAVLRHGHREAVRLEEVDPGGRAPILQRYLQLAPGARAHIPVDRHAPLAELERIASRYPVFRVRAASPPPNGGAPTAPAHNGDWPQGASSMSAIRAEGLTKRYGDTLALDALDLVVEPGEVYGYLGPNGAGKTTTIRLLLGLHRPSAGRAALFGIDAWRDPVAAHRRVAYVAGEPLLWPALTSAETLAFLARLHGGTDAAYRDLLIERFQLDTEKKIRALSKGNRQKVQLVAAFASRAELLILDEPTSGLDPLMEVAFRATVQEAKQRGQTVFLSSHILSEVEALCDRVGILRAGRLVDQGTLEQLRHLSAQTIEVTFEGPAPTFDGLPGVQVTSAGANALRFEVSGSVRPLLAALADQPVAALASREPSLEEIFLHHYETSSDGRGSR